MTPPDTDQHDAPPTRRPGELAFALFLLVASVGLLWNAYGIAGFEALSSPGAIPMATTAAMVISGAIIVWRTAALPRISGETLARDILPMVVIVMAGFLVGYAVLLKPLGFLPTSALFLSAAIKLLSRRSWFYALTVALGSLLVIWLIFRIVFTVLMPAGIVPEAEVIQFFRTLTQGAR